MAHEELETQEDNQPANLEDLNYLAQQIRDGLHEKPDHPEDHP